MLGLTRRIIIFAAVDGLVLQPSPPRNHPPTTQQAIKIDYKGNISPLLKDRRDEATAPASLEVHGIVGIPPSRAIGLLKIASSSFLISISRREQVAQIRGKPIYVITDVALIPLSSQADANKAITQARESLQKRLRAEGAGEELESDTSDDESVTYADTATQEDSLPSTPPPEEDIQATTANKRERRSSIAEDVVVKKGAYGRFADRWFSKKGWSTEGRRKLGMSSEEDLNHQQVPRSSSAAGPLDDGAADNDAPEKSEAVEAGTSGGKDADQSLKEIKEAVEDPSQDVVTSMMPKIVRTTRLYFSSRSFFYSYDYDISHSIGKQSTGHSSLPLFKLFDPLYFWNQHVIQPFIEAGQHSYVLPVLQGFVGQRAFSVDVSPDTEQSAVVDAASKSEDVIAAQNDATEPAESNSKPSVEEEQGRKDFLLTLISRRSVKRAGLRYLRRGVDDKGNVANSVETEQILSAPSWSSSDKIFSFTQYRGSIPLFFSQTPFSFKPMPTLHGSQETNTLAFRQHFSNLASRYGGIACASLVDKHGTEAKIGSAYEQHANLLNDNGGVDGKGTRITFHWFDFHAVCRGMKFENVSQLMDILGPTLSSFGWTVTQHDQLLQRQSGILRTNCMDCLDRTNVVQSACARHALEQQLATLHIAIDLQHDPSTSWFNTLWADNGDAISKQYAGTAALKGDFTRTRKRNIGGALTDFGLTLSRYYNNIVNDYFAQAVIDYLLGKATDQVFAEFEADMMSRDHAIDIRKVRQAAIDRSAEICVEEADEDLVGGWTLSCPAKANSLRATPFEECVLLLTERALYFVRFDWTTEKVREFERVDLGRVERLVKGVYVTSTLAKRHVDEKRNVGFVVSFEVGEGDEGVRVNTRSLGNERKEGEEEDGPGKGDDDEQQDRDTRSEEKAEQKATEMEKRFLAFKALPPRSSVASVQGEDNEPKSEMEMVTMVCEEIKRVADGARKAATGATAHDGEDGLEIEERDIISVAEAKKRTGYLEQIGYSMKKLVWG
ncbi:hypothetical protein H2199_006963 [Coniosporium tulheliwenetii]|uniref:Uncharacterized protein n=1 Tax=Coniosporium tulheliwenetii TaxID=3383036 RepID=A0ACC2YT46_9PEZI|nr:hypothetical protein H2199_006963 [Cladosporium sp. JES 115]